MNVSLLLHAGRLCLGTGVLSQTLSTHTAEGQKATLAGHQEPDLLTDPDTAY